MIRLFVAFVVSLLILWAFACAGDGSDEHGAAAPGPTVTPRPTPTFTPIRRPVWMVSPTAAVGPFEPGEPMKRVWLVDDDVAGEVKLTGRRLDGPGTVTFLGYALGYRSGNASAQVPTPPAAELVLVPPHGRRRDHNTAVSYPSAGCWQFTAEVGTEEVEIVEYLYPEK